MNEKYKINLHIIEACNYHCKHCFAKFDSRQILSIDQWKIIVNNLLNSIDVCEFNIAGGEPLLYKDLPELVQYIRQIGCKCSVISNGSLMTNTWIESYAKYFDTIGLSIDSLVPDTLISLGRADKNRSYVTIQRLAEICNLIKRYNQNCKIKLNTVVSRINKNENLYSKLQSLPIDRWKIIKMRTFADEKNDNSYLAINHEEFSEFVKYNLNILTLADSNQSYVCKIADLSVVIEEDLEGGYLIIDSNGCLIDNTRTSSHTIVADLTNEKCVNMLDRSNFNKDLYKSRYQAQELHEQFEETMDAKEKC